MPLPAHVLAPLEEGGRGEEAKVKQKQNQRNSVGEKKILFVPRHTTVSYNHQGTYLFTSNINKEERKHNIGLCCLKKN